MIDNASNYAEALELVTHAARMNAPSMVYTKLHSNIVARPLPPSWQQY